MIVLEADRLRKSYAAGIDEVPAVRGVSLALSSGELVLLMGPSGSGKTTILSILGCILRPDEGTLAVHGHDIPWDEALLPAYRRRYFGFVYQSFNLLSSLTVRENVKVPLLLSGKEDGLAEEVADHALGTVDLTHRAHFSPSDLSGGEKQRAAIARAIATDAPILLADEPTGNLDSDNGRQVMRTLRALARRRGKTVLVVTHDDRWIPYADRVLRMEDGMLTDP